MWSISCDILVKVNQYSTNRCTHNPAIPCNLPHMITVEIFAWAVCRALKRPPLILSFFHSLRPHTPNPALTLHSCLCLSPAETGKGKGIAPLGKRISQLPQLNLQSFSHCSSGFSLLSANCEYWVVAAEVLLILVPLTWSTRGVQLRRSSHLF